MSGMVQRAVATVSFALICIATPASAADDTVLIGLPSRGRVATHRIVRHLTVVEIGERRVEVRGTVAGKVAARM